MPRVNEAQLGFAYGEKLAGNLESAGKILEDEHVISLIAIDIKDYAKGPRGRGKKSAAASPAKRR